MEIRKAKVQSGQMTVTKKNDYIKPKITLTGKWLKEAGFEINCKLEIKVIKNKIIIIKNEE